MNDNLDEEKMKYFMLDATYVKSRNREISWDSDKNSDLYPSDWYINSDYNKKSEILAEAIEKGITIEETDGYQDIIEGVKFKSR